MDNGYNGIAFEINLGEIMQKPTALVIGAGIGGIATAARLAKNGYEVTV